MAQKIFPRILKILGCLLLLTAILIAAFGIWYGISETDAFYQRQDDYYAFEDERVALREQIDSLQNICQVEAPTDSLAPCFIQAQIDSIEQSERYKELFGEPAPPMGFSLAGMLTILCCLIALIPLVVGILLIVISHRCGQKS